MVGTLIRRPLPPVSDFIRTLLDDTTATAALATLGIISGTYTPTLTNSVNLDASTAFLSRYIIIGDVVAVMGSCQVDPTAAGSVATNLGISLPIASDFTATNQCGGVMTIVANGVGAGNVTADIANNRALAAWLSGTTTNGGAGFSFMYTVL